MNDEYSDYHSTSAGPVPEGEPRTIQQPQGVTRVQVVPNHLLGSIGASEAAPPSGPRSRVYGGIQRFTNGQAEADDVGVTRHSVSREGAPGGSVLATLQRHGPRPSVELIPGQPGTRTYVDTAIREGLLIRNPHTGQLEDAPALQQQVQAFEQRAQQPQAREQPAADPEVFDPKIEAAWAEETASLPAFAVDAATARMVAHLAHGQGDLDSMAKALARDAGIDPALAREQVENGLWVHQQAAEKALASVGVSGEKLQAFYGDLRAQPGRMQEAMQRLVHGRDHSSFVALGKAWASRQARHAGQGG